MMIERFLGVATVGSTLAGIGLLQRFLLNMTTIIVLAIASSFMIFVMLTGLLAMFYASLVTYGIASLTASIITLGLASLMTGGFITATYIQFKRLKQTSYPHLEKYRNNWPDIAGIADAFVSGFLGHKK